jgi:hypothetical protein
MALNEQDFERLSAYLDNELSPAERVTLEARLLAEPELQTELAQLRQLLKALNAMPELKVPRSYALTPALLEKSAPTVTKAVTVTPKVIPLPRRNNFQWIVGAAATFIVVVLGFGFVLSTFIPSEENINVGEVAFVNTLTPTFFDTAVEVPAESTEGVIDAVSMDAGIMSAPSEITTTLSSNPSQPPVAQSDVMSTAQEDITVKQTEEAQSTVQRSGMAGDAPPLEQEQNSTTEIPQPESQTLAVMSATTDPNAIFAMEAAPTGGEGTMGEENMLGGMPADNANAMNATGASAGETTAMFATSATVLNPMDILLPAIIRLIDTLLRLVVP